MVAAAASNYSVNLIGVCIIIHISIIDLELKVQFKMKKSVFMLKMSRRRNFFCIELVCIMIIKYRQGENLDFMLAAVPWLVQMAIYSDCPHKHWQYHN